MDDPKELKTFLDQYRINKTDDILLGIFQTGMTVYNQQLRALNIFYALHELGEIKKGDNLAIIGAGVAGMSFAVAALDKGYKVDLFEKTSLLLPFQYGSDTRRIHPHFYNWPQPLSEYPYSELPFFRWRYDTASKVSKDIYRSYRELVEDLEDPNSYNEYRNTYVTGSDIDRKKDGVQISFSSNKGQKQKKYKKLIVAIGFGIEKRIKLRMSNKGNNIKVLSDSYWRNDQFEQVDLYEGKIENYLVSGIGDGAFMDMFRLRIKGFTIESIIQNLREEEGFQILRIKLNEIVNKKIEINKTGKPLSNSFLFDEFEILFNSGDLNICEEILKNRVRIDTNVILHHRRLNFREIFSLDKASMFSNFLAYVLFKMNKVKFFKCALRLNYDATKKFVYKKVDEESLKNKKLENENNLIDFVNEISTKYTISNLINILIRHGADKRTPLKNYGLEDSEIDRIEELQRLNSMSNHLFPIWPIDFFEKSKASKHFVEPDLLTLANTFVSGVSSIIKHIFKSEVNDDSSTFKICLHRVVKRSKGFYYQQVSDYYGNENTITKENIGRIFPIEKGLVGYSFKTGQSLRLTKESDDLTAWNLLMMMPGERLKNKDRTYKDFNDQSNSLFTCPIFCKSEDKLYPVFCLYMSSSRFKFYEDGEEDKKVLELIYRMSADFVSQLNQMINVNGILQIDDLRDILPPVNSSFKTEPMNAGIEDAANIQPLDSYNELKEKLTFENITPNYLTLNYRYKV